MSSMTERFWAKVDKDGPVIIQSLGPCWMFTGAITRSGYGNFTVRKGLWAPAHRVSYEFIHGPIPPSTTERLTLDHLCRNRGCVNPSHLELVTNKENILRGASPWAQRARMTHCTHGHEFTAENTRIRPNGTRACRTCAREMNRGNVNAAYWRDYRARRTAEGRPVGRAS